MEWYIFILGCTFVSSVLSFTLEQGQSDFNYSNSTSLRIQNYDRYCSTGKCKSLGKCECCPGYGSRMDSWFTYYCDRCDCGGTVKESFNCTFFLFMKTCVCPEGYFEHSKYCKEKDAACKELCGNNTGITCKVDYMQKAGLSCSCKNEEHGYDESDRQCKDLCKDICGNNVGVICNGDKTKKRSIYCSCQDESQAFDKEDKQCKAKEIVFCKEVCGNNDGVICGGNKTKKESIRCSCQDEKKGFDEKDKQCKVCFRGKCKDPTNCVCCPGYGFKGQLFTKSDMCEKCDCGENYSCAILTGDSVELKICQCPEGHVQNFESCKEKDIVCEDVCGNNAGVTCDTNGNHPLRSFEGVWCNCENRSHAFDKSDKQCKDTCDNILKNCTNGGTCMKKDGNMLCSCKNGTSGHFCDVVDECESYSAFCGDDLSSAVCEYDLSGEKAVCLCKNSSLQFDSNKKQCRDTCDNITKTCENGGTCMENNGNRFCFCKDGTSGHFCDVVDKCKSNPSFCGDEKISGAVCKYDADNEKAVCLCKNNSLQFDENMEKCRDTCDNTMKTCKNGGTCVEKDETMFCSCKNGTRGHFCDIIVECESNPRFCGDEELSSAVCKYDAENEKAVCWCKNNSLEFDEKKKQCRDKCDSVTCNNEGICNVEYGKPVCICTNEYEGEFCERHKCDAVACYNKGKCKVEDGKPTCVCTDEFEGEFCESHKCDNFICTNGGACKVEESNPVCHCTNEYEGRYCEMHKCSAIECLNDGKCAIQKGIAVCNCTDKYSGKFCEKEACRVSSDCFNGGTCIKSGSTGYCLCLEGTKGPFCEEVLGCFAKECGYNAKCEYDVEKRIAMCKCIDETFEFDKVDFQCKKICHSSSDCMNGGTCTGSESYGFCQCLNGTTGEFCEKVPECNYKDCGYDAKCSFDVKRKSASCMCVDKDLAFDAISKVCKIQCNQNEDCQNKGLCMHRGYNRFCHCIEGTHGHFCEEIDMCNEQCGKEDNVVCEYNLEQKIAQCLCRDDKYEFDVATKSCKKRFCVKKKCLHGKCEVKNNEEVCICYEGYSLDGDECRKKTCTHRPCLNGTCIVRHGGIEECICPSGYTLRGNACIRGSCRQDTCYGGVCKTVDGELTCICPERFHLEGIGCYETVCVRQRCFGGKCVVENGEEVCTCKEGYTLENDVCKKILCEKKNCFGGQCHIRDGVEECECPLGYTIVEDVCVRDNTRTRM